MGLFRSLAIGLFVLAVPAALLTSNVRFAASEHRVYDYSVREYDAASKAAIPEPELLRAARELVAYFTAEDPPPLSIQVRDMAGREGPLFSARETAHLADVRDLFQATFALQVLAVATVVTIGVMMLVWWPVRALAAAALYASALTVGLISLAGVVALAGFDSAWTQFHFLAFTNDLWQLDPGRDHLIQMFPEPFWQDVTLLIGAFTLLQAMLIAGVAGAYLFLTHAQVAEPAPAGPRLLEEPIARHPRPRIPPPHPRHYIH